MLGKIYNFLFDGIGSDLANYFGLVLTIVGFIASIRSKNAADAAKSETFKMRNEIVRFNILADLSTAIKKMDEISIPHRRESVSSLISNYSSLIDSLISIKSYDLLSSDHQAKIQGIIQTIHDIKIKIEQTNDKTHISEFSTSITEQKEVLKNILLDLQKDISQKNNGGKYAESKINPSNTNFIPKDND